MEVPGITKNIMTFDTLRIRTQTNTADARTEYVVYRGGIDLAWFAREDDAKLFVKAKFERAAKVMLDAADQI